MRGGLRCTVLLFGFAGGRVCGLGGATRSWSMPQGKRAAAGSEGLEGEAKRLKVVAADDGDEFGLHMEVQDALLINTNDLEWRSSGPAAKVERKRLFRNGPPESGRVTSLVRYRPNAAFPSHPHPQGEEILVLEGVFEDWRGAHGPGTWLLNPEGFEHEPKTDGQGNLIFVRLRQYPGTQRTQAAIDTNSMSWDPNNRKVLYAQATFLDTQYLEMFWGGSKPQKRVAPAGGLELFVVSGEFTSNHGKHETHSWLRLKGGVLLEPDEGAEDCVVLIKENGEPCWMPPLPAAKEGEADP
eukprot:scaffold4197_cov199-Pinguiococcus_pyrenoidosus.AAC.2